MATDQLSPHPHCHKVNHSLLDSDNGEDCKTDPRLLDIERKMEMDRQAHSKVTWSASRYLTDFLYLFAAALTQDAATP
ncbi:hypothetical protein FRC10_005361 [Ceratobasidium sp. 414]|nr:hypothetical protein FRC10_005361 [Ceratobasidium sp. 414]